MHVPLPSLLPLLLHQGLDGKSEPCQRFFRDGLTLSFVRVLDDDAVNAWNPDIQVSRGSSCGRSCTSFVLLDTAAFRDD